MGKVAHAHRDSCFPAELRQQGQEAGKGGGGGDGTRDQASTVSLSPSVPPLLHPRVSLSQRDALAFRPCSASARLGDLAGPGAPFCPLRNGSAKFFSAHQGCLPPHLVGPGCRQQGGRRAPEDSGRPAAGHSRLILSADASKLACFYNSKANISCVWSRDGDPRATSCKIHAQSDQR